MTCLIEVLRSYAEKNRIPPQLLKSEYIENRDYSREHLRWLETHLDKKAKQHLDDYITMAMLADGEYCDALFRSGLSLGLELALLAQFPE